jgi:hypothetical protein
MMSNNIEFDLTEKLRENGITRIAKENNSVIIHYNENSIRFDIEYNNCQQTIKNFETVCSGIITDIELVSYLKLYLAQKLQNIISKEEKDFSHKDSSTKPIFKAFKYSCNGQLPLHEAIILDNQPVFIIYNNKDEKVEVVEEIQEPTRIIRPPTQYEYPYTPYQFSNIDEVNKFVTKAKGMKSVGHLYLIAKDIYKKYIDQEEYIIVILCADTILTYFQDLFPTIHYCEGVGDNDAGKSSIGFTFEYTAYRVVKGTSISGANYNRVLGTIEPGQCTIAEDEGDSISEDQEKVKLLKSGYEYNSKIPKINMNTKEQDQKWYYPYCYKMILAEKSLNQSKARGLVDRTFSFHCKPGNVTYSIKDVVSENINKSPQNKMLYNQILFFRKLMICYRIVHYRDPLPEITTGLTNRENELIKPLLQLFYGSEVLSEIIDALIIFVKQRRERKSNSVEAVLYPIIKEIIDDLATMHNLISIPFSTIWSKIIDGSIIDGSYDFDKPNEYETQDYIIYKNTLSKLIRDKFGAKLERKPYGSSLIFNKAEFAKFDKVYDNPDPMLIKLEVKSDITSSDLGEEKYDNIDLMLDSVDNINKEDVGKCEVSGTIPIEEEKIIGYESNEGSIENSVRIHQGDVDNEGNEGIKFAGSNTISEDENRTGNEESLENSVDVNEENVGYVGNVGISECASINKEENEKDILTNNDSMKDNSQNNNLPIFNNNYNYNNKNKTGSLSENDKKDDTHPLEPTQPTLPTSSSSIIELSTLQCPLCDYMGIEIEMEVHLTEKHRYEIKKRDDIPGGDFDSKINVILERLKKGDKICYASTIQ